MESMDYTAWRFWMDVAQLAGVVLLGIYAWITNRHKANRSAIDRVEEQSEMRDEAIVQRVTDLVRRQDVIEQQLKSAPTHNDISKVYDRLNAINESVKGMAGEFSGLKNTLQLLHSYLLNHGDK